MRRFGIGTVLVLVLGFAVGCEKPIEQGMPSPSGANLSAADELSVEMPAEKPADEAKPEEAAPATPKAEDAKPAEPKAEEAKPAEAKAEEAKPAEPKAEEAKPAEAKEEPKTSSTEKSTAAKLVATSLKVPTMSCPHGCWPTVKETLAKQAGVASVELAKQANADAIDNPVVTVKLSGKFDSKAAIDALAKAGFANAEVVN